MRRIDFMIAGVQKSGTTALYTFLSQHPKIFLPAEKELHFFDNERLAWNRPDYSSLRQHFSACPDGCIAGEATPIYTYWRPAALRIQRYNPEIRLIVMFRNPVERAYSHWRMEVSRGNDDLDFGEAIRDGRRRVIMTAEVSGCHRIFSYVERGFYAEQIQRLLSLFAPDQLLFVRTEDFWNRHTETLGCVCDFLGVDRFAEFPKQSYVVPMENSDPRTLSSEDRTYLLDLYSDDIKHAQRLTGLDLSAWIA